MEIFEFKVNDNTLFLDKEDIFEIPKNTTGHFKFKINNGIGISNAVRIFNTVRMATDCDRIIDNGSKLVITFTEPEFGRTNKIKKNIDLRF